MRYVTYKGSLYSKANERIRGLKALNRPYSITTTEEQVPVENFLYWKVKAEIVMLDTHEVFSGVAMRRLEQDHPFGKYALEWAETVATARAIGKMGIGIDYSYACLEELGDLNMRDVEDQQGGAPPKVEMVDDKPKFTEEDMKACLGQQDEDPQPVVKEKKQGSKGRKPAKKADVGTVGEKKKSVDKPDKVDSMLNDIESKSAFDDVELIPEADEPTLPDIPDDEYSDFEDVVIEID